VQAGGNLAKVGNLLAAVVADQRVQITVVDLGIEHEVAHAGGLVAAKSDDLARVRLDLRHDFQRAVGIGGGGAHKPVGGQGDRAILEGGRVAGAAERAGAPQVAVQGRLVEFFQEAGGQHDAALVEVGDLNPVFAAAVVLQLVKGIECDCLRGNRRGGRLRLGRRRLGRRRLSWRRLSWLRLGWRRFGGRGGGFGRRRAGFCGRWGRPGCRRAGFGSRRSGFRGRWGRFGGRGSGFGGRGGRAATRLAGRDRIHHRRVAAVGGVQADPQLHVAVGAVDRATAGGDIRPTGPGAAVGGCAHGQRHRCATGDRRVPRHRLPCGAGTGVQCLAGERAAAHKRRRDLGLVEAQRAAAVVDHINVEVRGSAGDGNLSHGAAVNQEADGFTAAGLGPFHAVAVHSGRDRPEVGELVAAVMVHQRVQVAIAGLGAEHQVTGAAALAGKADHLPGRFFKLGHGVKAAAGKGRIRADHATAGDGYLAAAQAGAKRPTAGGVSRPGRGVQRGLGEVIGQLAGKRQAALQRVADSGLIQRRHIGVEFIIRVERQGTGRRRSLGGGRLGWLRLGWLRLRWGRFGRCGGRFGSCGSRFGGRGLHRSRLRGRRRGGNRAARVAEDHQVAAVAFHHHHAGADVRVAREMAIAIGIADRRGGIVYVPVGPVTRAAPVTPVVDERQATGGVVGLGIEVGAGGHAADNRRQTLHGDGVAGGQALACRAVEDARALAGTPVSVEQRVAGHGERRLLVGDLDERVGEIHKAQVAGGEAGNGGVIQHHFAHIRIPAAVGWVALAGAESDIGHFAAVAVDLDDRNGRRFEEQAAAAGAGAFFHAAITHSRDELLTAVGQVERKQVFQGAVIGLQQGAGFGVAAGVHATRAGAAPQSLRAEVETHKDDTVLLGDHRPEAGERVRILRRVAGGLDAPPGGAVAVFHGVHIQIAGGIDDHAGFG